MQLHFENDNFPSLCLYNIEDVETENGRDDIYAWVKKPEQKHLGFVELGYRTYATGDGRYVYCQAGHQNPNSFYTSSIFRYRLDPPHVEILKKVLASRG